VFDFLIHILVVATIYGIVAVSLNLYGFRLKKWGGISGERGRR